MSTGLGSVYESYTSTSDIDCEARSKRSRTLAWKVYAVGCGPLHNLLPIAAPDA